MSLTETPDFASFNDVNIVTAIIPQHRAQIVMEKIASAFSLQTIQFDARGTIAHERWYQRFIPMLNPENEYLQYMIPRSNVKGFIEQLIKFAGLHLAGAGAVFSMPCNSYVSNYEEFMCTSIAALTEGDLSSFNVKQKQSALFTSLQSDRTDSAIRAAMQAGSHGPIVYFSEGRGIRDQIGWLKITKKPYEEVILSIVDASDKQVVIDAITDAGRIRMPGAGILYDQILDYSLVNLPTSTGSRNRLANDHQIIGAIDELMGHSDWRNDSALSIPKTRLKKQSRHKSKELRLLVMLVPRKHAYTLMDKALELGAPGANVTFVKQLGGEKDIDKSGFAIHYEMGLIRMVLPSDQSQSMAAQMQKHCETEDINKTTIFETTIAQSIHYQAN